MHTAGIVINLIHQTYCVTGGDHLPWPDSEPCAAPVQLSRYLAAVKAATESVGNHGNLSQGFRAGA